MQNLPKSHGTNDFQSKQINFSQIFVKSEQNYLQEVSFFSVFLVTLDFMCQSKQEVDKQPS